MKSAKSFLLFIALLPMLTQAQEDNEIRPLREAPVAQLPRGLKGTPGHVTLVSDFVTTETDRRMPVYLINLSEKDIKLNAQDHDVYLKLETQTDKGEWVRAQPHTYSWCGNSYMDQPSLRKGHFFLIRGYQNGKGQKAKIRYHLYNQKGLDLVTEPGEGLSFDLDVQASAADKMSIDSASFDHVSKIATGEVKPVNPYQPDLDLQEQAIWALGSKRFTAEQVAPVLDAIDAKSTRFVRETFECRVRLGIKVESKTQTTEPSAKNDPFGPRAVRKP